MRSCVKDRPESFASSWWKRMIGRGRLVSEIDFQGSVGYEGFAVGANGHQASGAAQPPEARKPRARLEPGGRSVQASRQLRAQL